MPVALAMGRIVESLLYEVTPQDALALAWVAGLLLLTGAARQPDPRLARGSSRFRPDAAIAHARKRVVEFDSFS